MSFRNPFITDFIYGADERVKSMFPAIEEVFKNNGITLVRKPDKRGMGYYCGLHRTSGGELDEYNLSRLRNELDHATKIPFRLTILQESGPVITFDIQPR